VKPAALMVSWKGPGAKFAKENWPSSPVVSSAAEDCGPWLGAERAGTGACGVALGSCGWLGAAGTRVSRTFAPATAAPLGSTTVPLMFPGSCWPDDGLDCGCASEAPAGDAVGGCGDCARAWEALSRIPRLSPAKLQRRKTGQPTATRRGRGARRRPCRWLAILSVECIMIDSIAAACNPSSF
jgi:hypothetical protein